jgi:hypothetical protein
MTVDPVCSHNFRAFLQEKVNQLAVDIGQDAFTVS